MKKQANGLYRTKVVIGHDPYGKPINKWVSGKTKKELESNKQKIVEKFINGNKLLDDITFGEYAKSWYEVKKKPFISIGTQAHYSSILNGRLLPVFRDRKISTITNTDIQAYINTLSDLSVARVSGILKVLTAVFGSAMAEGYIRVNPTAKVRIDAKPNKEKHALTKDERSRIESVCRSNEDGIMLSLLYYTGIRDGEMCALKWSDIDLDGNTIYIHGSLKHDRGTYVGKPKTSSSIRYVPIPAPLHDILTEYSKGSSTEDFVIHLRNDPSKPIQAYELRIRWSRLMEACEIGTREKVTNSIHWRSPITPHALRHNYTTMLYENGIDPYTASKLLGHSSIKTTMNIYTHFSEQAMIQAQESVNKIWKVAQK